MKTFFKNRNRVLIALTLIVFIGAFLRLYHLSDWLHFELDQARDARVIALAIDGGIGNLPLMGPRAGGTFLRLGPGFYYIEYIGAFIFGMTPGGLAVPIALFSIASIVIFYFFIRRYLSELLSLGLTLLFSVSAFLVLYGRFAWNPNPLPFFLMFGFYSLLRAMDNDEKNRDRWFIASAFLLAFATHLHFVAFVSLPIITSLFLLIKRARFSWKTWMMAIVLALSLYIPMILNEMITGGANTQEFLQAVQGKSNKSNHTLLEQSVRNVTNQASGYWVILTGYEESSMGQLVSSGPFNFELTCDNDCHIHFLSGFLAMMIFVCGYILLVWRFFKETRAKERDFLLLSLLWSGMCFVLFLPLSYDFAPRFFLLIAPFPFLFLGLILAFLQEYFAKYKVTGYSIGVLLFAFVVSNVFFTTHRLNELRNTAAKSFDILPDRILKEKARVTLEQQNLVLDYMQGFQKVNKYPIYMFSEPEHRRALKYLMERRGMQNDVLGYTGGIYTQGTYFLVIRTVSNHVNRLQKYMVAYDAAAEKKIGTLTVFHLVPKVAAITADAQVMDTTPSSTMSAPGVPERYTWSEWWNHKSGTSDDEPTDDESDQ